MRDIVNDWAIRRTTLAPLVLLGLLALVATTAAAGPSGEGADAQLGAVAASSRCAAAKQKVALARLRAIHRCYQRPAQLGTQQPNQVCLDNVERRFRSEHARIEARGECMPATGDADAVAHFVDGCALGLYELLPGACLPAGSECGTIGFCCAPLACTGVVGQTPTCR